MNHHTVDPVCTLCEEKLQTAHPILQGWFRAVKRHIPTVHISDAFRNQEEQNRCFHNGSSRLEYPNSKHNRCGLDGAPCSHALDLFELRDGKAYFEMEFYRNIFKLDLTREFAITWGGNFKRCKDGPHFEITFLTFPLIFTQGKVEKLRANISSVYRSERRNQK